mmetsp:Transcript_65460/g.156374  ORF Transcript_65460/g.156374 Transcript_65460/m.156374 type:complete len:213 (+) Transcript_65460:738-1376(+)
MLGSSLMVRKSCGPFMVTRQNLEYSWPKPSCRASASCGLISCNSKASRWPKNPGTGLPQSLGFGTVFGTVFGTFAASTTIHGSSKTAAVAAAATAAAWSQSSPAPCTPRTRAVFSADTSTRPETCGRRGGVRLSCAAIPSICTAAPACSRSHPMMLLVMLWQERSRQNRSITSPSTSALLLERLATWHVSLTSSCTEEPQASNTCSKICRQR